MSERDIKPNGIVITTALLDELETNLELEYLETLEDFKRALKQELIVIYLMVNWSGPERFSRYNIFKSLEKDKFIKDRIKIIDCSDQKKIFLEEWLKNQKEEYKYFYTGGYGETIFVKKNNINKYFKNPGSMSVEEIENEFKNWRSNV